MRKESSVNKSKGVKPMTLKLHQIRGYSIVTDFQCPPIPYRNMDWVAYVDGEEELGEYGYGSTEQEAISDLLDLLNDKD